MAGRLGRPATGEAFVYLIMNVLLFDGAYGATSSEDVAAMLELSSAIGAASIGWRGSDPCEWPHVNCIGNRVTSIQIPDNGVSGTLPASISKLTELNTLALQNNKLSGAIPVLSGLSNLQTLYLDNNNFSSIPDDVFSGLIALQKVRLDYNPLASWTIPSDLQFSTSLQSFTASKANAAGTIPDIFASLPNLSELKLSYNNLTGVLPPSFAKSSIRTLWLNNQKGEKLNGSIAVLGEMPNLGQVWLHSNAFTGPIPDLSGSVALFDLQLRDNSLTGVVPNSLTSLGSLQNVSLGNNELQGAVPTFPNSVTDADVGEKNNFCLPDPGPCDSRINILLAIAADVNYPTTIAASWKGNDPCSGWRYVTCDSQGNITVLNFANQHFVGTISPAIANLTALRSLLLGNNNLTGTIPNIFTTLPNLQTVDVTNNNLTGTLPSFNQSVTLKVSGNPHIGHSTSDGSDVDDADASENVGPSSSVEVGLRVGVAIFVLLFVGLVVFYCHRKRCCQKLGLALTTPLSYDSDHIKLNIGSDNASSEEQSVPSSGACSFGDQGGMLIAVQLLQQGTNNFSQSNIIGEGGFGVVYKGELHDGTKIAVKRMEGVLPGKKGMNEFMVEIDVLTKVRHRHLVELLGYCIHGNERLLVYEYMSQGTLGQHLFEGMEKGFSFLNWKTRLAIALDVARGVEYLHNLAHKSFIHRDLKPSNILLDDNMRAKVSDFGLVKPAPDGKHSIETQLAGTFGYLAPEYATTGRVTTKVDVYAFGVILMEMITARKALVNSEVEEDCYLVNWFHKMLIKSDVGKVVDRRINVDDEETFKSIRTVAELARHCTAREPNQRPDMGHVVNVLAPLVEQWKPSNSRDEDISDHGLNFGIPLSVALQRWKACEFNSMTTSDIYGDVTATANTPSSISSGSLVFNGRSPAKK